jgi:ribosomal protein S18 acetylase RimI-like enzyme
MIAALAGMLPGGETMRTTPADLAAQIGRPDPLLHAVLGERGGSAIGVCVWLSYFSTWKGRGLYIQDLYVAESERMHGLGNRLLGAAMCIARRDGARFVRLSVDAANARAAPFYRRLGFVEDHADRMFTLSGEAFDALAADIQAQSKSSE